MKQTVQFSDFCDAFHAYGRDHQFSYNGKRALFDFLEEQEADIGEELELDVIALCCDFVEYANLADFQADYNVEDYPDVDAIASETIVIRIDDDAFIIQQF